MAKIQDRKIGVPEGYYGLRDICRIFGRSRSSVYRMFADTDKRLPKPMKTGKQLLWDKHEIDNHVKYGKFLNNKKGKSNEQK